ncbi:hypothetical protein D3C81_338590 [compost metagenome]
MTNGEPLHSFFNLDSMTANVQIINNIMFEKNNQQTQSCIRQYINLNCYGELPSKRSENRVLF